jgi:glycosyltransferase involved in cell wall biosynthesis
MSTYHCHSLACGRRLVSEHPGGDPHPLRIVRIIARLNVGGPSIQAITLAASMRALGYETHLVRGLGGPREGSMDGLAERLGVTPKTLSSLRREIGLRDVVALGRLWRLLQRQAPDIVHTHAAKAGTLGRLAALIGPRRPSVLVHTFHGHVLEGYFSPRSARLFQAIERRLATRTDCLIAVSPEIRDDLVRLRIAPPHKVHVVPLGFDLSRFTVGDAERRRRGAAFRAHWNVDPDCRLVTLVARLVPVKRVDRFLRIADRLAADPRFHFLIVGDGELHDQLRSRAEAVRLDSRLTWTGNIDAIEDVYFASDIAVLTSDNEGTPVSLIEAQAAGVPVVSTNVGGVRSVVDDGVSGLLVAPDDDQGFAAAIVRLAENEPLARSYGAAGRRRVTERFTLAGLTADLDRLYRKLAGEQRRRDPGKRPTPGLARP